MAGLGVMVLFVWALGGHWLARVSLSVSQPPPCRVISSIPFSLSLSVSRGDIWAIDSLLVPSNSCGGGDVTGCRVTSVGKPIVRYAQCALRCDSARSDRSVYVFHLFSLSSRAPIGRRLSLASLSQSEALAVLLRGSAIKGPV